MGKYLAAEYKFDENFKGDDDFVKSYGVKPSKEQPNNVFLIHREGNATRLYKNGVKISPEKFNFILICFFDIAK